MDIRTPLGTLDFWAKKRRKTRPFDIIEEAGMSGSGIRHA